MKSKNERDEAWIELEKVLLEELEKVRRGALLAESFDEMEDIVVATGQELQQAMLAAAAAQREPLGRPKCPDCGEPMDRKGKKPRTQKTSVGEVVFERERWTCPACGASLFPPG
jgi:uncharacterized protein with PIN domain